MIPLGGHSLCNRAGRTTRQEAEQEPFWLNSQKDFTLPKMVLAHGVHFPPKGEIMYFSALSRFVSLTLVALALVACGPRETPEQHIARLRRSHDIIPTGAATVENAEGMPRLVVDLRITNQTDEPLAHLTIRVRVENIEGQELLSQLVTLDLSHARPGVGVQLAALIDDFRLDEQDQVMVEVEDGLTPEQLRALPEFADLSQ